MLEHREHTWIVCFDMEAPGIRYLKTVFGGEGGERFVLDCLQRIEGEMREGDHLFRIAGDKFVLLASSEAYETVLDQAERVFRRNGEKVHYQGNAVELAMFGGLIRLDQGDARSERLFEKLDGVLGRRWELTKRRRVQEEAEEAAALYILNRDFLQEPCIMDMKSGKMSYGIQMERIQTVFGGTGQILKGKGSICHFL